MMVNARRLVRAVMLVALVALFTAPGGSAQVILGWQIESVDTEGHVGYFTSLALDSAGRPHISYLHGDDATLRYAFFDGTSWQTETVDTVGALSVDADLSTSLTLDADDQPHISYFDGVSGDLKYAALTGTGWQVETIDSEGLVGLYSSLALDGDGHPHISYDDITNGDLKYAAFDGTSWQITTVDSEGVVGGVASLALDRAGQPHISYFDDTHDDLKYAAFDGTAWRTETVDGTGDVGWDTSLALDDAGRPHISYFDFLNEDLKYATYDGTDWQIETVDAEGAVGWFTSLALDSTGQPHISYADFATADLKYAAFDGTSWQIETVDAEGDTGAHSSLALDAAGLPHISYNAYYGVSDTALRYAYIAFNAPPAVDAGGSYTGTEGSPITLLAAVNDREGDDLTTRWTYEVNSADDGTTCSFGDDGQVTTTFTCTDDGVYTLTLEADDGINPTAADTATITISNSAPTVKLGDDVTINQVDGFSDTGSFADPGSNDTHTATVDYGDGSAPQPLTLTNGNFSLSHIYGSAGQFTVEVCVADDDEGASCDELAVQVNNQQPAVSAGGPYSGAEGSPISLQGNTSDPESDELTIVWSYIIDSADPGTTCTFSDPGQLATTFTCTDDGAFTVTLTASDGLNPAVSDSAAVTIANADPVITKATAALATSRVTITVAASDPGANDVLSYVFNCDADNTYEVDAGATPTTACPRNLQNEGAFIIRVQVTDDNGGVTIGTVNVTIASELCASDYTGVLRYSDACHDYETAVTIPDHNGPVMVCASIHNGLLRLPANGLCAGHEISYLVPEDGPLSVCVNTYTLTMRVAGNAGQCSSNEFGRVIGATEIGATPPRTR